MTLELQKMSDAELYSKCKHFGEISLKYRWKFAGLLPEVNRRRLYEKKGFGSIFEFAAKLAGMSEKQVRRVLNLDERFEKMPTLNRMLVEGKASVNKLARVASVATPENEEFWGRQVNVMSKSALETLVRDEKFAAAGRVAATAGQQEKSVPGHNFLSVNAADLGLSSSTVEKLLEFKRRGIPIDELINKFLNQWELEIALEKEALSAEAKTTDSRYIPTKIRELVKKEYGTKCSIVSCDKPSQAIHHSQRFGLAQTHDPKFLAPLCREHHIIAHAVDLQFREFRAHSGP